jgi:phosphate transport system substrate-binding protein
LLGAVVGLVALRRPPTLFPSVKPTASASASALPVIPPPLLSLEGSGTIGVKAAPQFVEAFLKKRGAVRVERRAAALPEESFVVATMPSGELESIRILSEGTSKGMTCLAEKTCDIAMASREISSEEAASLVAKGVGDVRGPATEHVIALDGIAIIVHPNNPLAGLDRPKVGQVLAGDATDWSAVGGAPGPIEIVSHMEGSGTTDVLKTLVLGGRDIAPSAKRLPDNTQISETVSVTPNSIGFVGLAFVGNAKALAISDRNVMPRLPTPFTVTTEAYPLARRFYLYTPTRPKGLALELVDFVVSSEGQKEIRAAHFVDLEVSMKNAEPCDKCPAKYSALVKRARRLSLDFRFRPGTQTLDARATRDIDRVVAFLRERSSAKLLLLGFSEATRDAKGDQKRALELAQVVDGALGARGLRATTVAGLGGEMPLAWGDSEAVRTKNRRVEIWIQSD